MNILELIVVFLSFISVSTLFYITKQMIISDFKTKTITDTQISVFYLNVLLISFCLTYLTIPLVKENLYFLYEITINNLIFSSSIMGFMFLFVFFYGWIRQKEMLGIGDIPIIGVCSLLLGQSYFNFIIGITTSAFIALFYGLYLKYKKQDLEIPFVPFLILGFVITYIFIFLKLL